MTTNKLIRLKKNRVFAEGAAAMIVILGSFIEMAHIATSRWLDVFLYNGDSLTLPIIRQSLARKEEVLWVFSSSLNLFPEGILYAFSSTFTSSISTSLLINGVVNILLFYILIRLIIGLIPGFKPNKQVAYSLFCTFMLLGYMLLESYTHVGNQSMATYFAFTTYYDGLIICGLLVLYIILLSLKSNLGMTTKKQLCMSAIILTVSVLATASNPLFFPQIIAPLMLALFICYLFKLMSRKQFLVLAGIQLLGFGLALVARHFLGSFIGQSLNDHRVNYTFSAWEHTLQPLSSLAPQNPTHGTYIRVLISVAVYFITLFYILLKLNKKLKQKRTRLEPVMIFILTFIAVQPVVLVSLLSISNGLQIRYLITSVILPLLGLAVVLIHYESKRFQKYFMCSVIGVAFIVAVCGLLSIPRFKPLVNAGYSDTDCLASKLGHKPANGVSDYWTARALDVYGQDGIRVLQVGSNQPYAWLDNLATYKDKEFSFAVVPRQSPIYVNISEELAGYSKPAKISTCPSFLVLHYLPNTDAYKSLNSSMRSSLDLQIKLRHEGKISKYNSRHR